MKSYIPEPYVFKWVDVWVPVSFCFTVILALTLATGCALKHPVEVLVPTEVKVLVTVPDCEELQLVTDAIDLCITKLQPDTGDVKGLCQQAIDAQKMRACLVNFRNTFNQEAIDCRVSAAAKLDPPK